MNNKMKNVEQSTRIKLIKDVHRSQIIAKNMQYVIYMLCVGIFQYLSN